VISYPLASHDSVVLVLGIRRARQKDLIASSETISWTWCGGGRYIMRQEERVSAIDAACIRPEKGNAGRYSVRLEKAVG
jgi:hypothetical protein